jgi:hypothetical protein
MKPIPALALLLAAFAVEAAPTAELARHGLTRFERVERHEVPGAPGRATYETFVSYVEATNRIPLAKGNGYSVYLVPRGGSGPVDVRWVVRAPSPGMRDPRSGVVHRQAEFSEPGAYGREIRAGWQFDFDFQMLPGRWQMEVFVGGRPWRSFAFDAFAP